MSEQGMFSGRIIDRVINKEIEEKLYADNDQVTTSYAKVQEGTIPDGYIGVIVSLAVSSDDSVLAYIERDEKQYYENGLNCGGMSHVPETGTDQFGVGDEIPLLIRIKERGKWALGFRSTSGTPVVSWRLRVRHIKKG